MFDLEQAVAIWRGQTGIDSSEVLDELESHLREAFEAQLQRGTNPQHAFELATKQIGHPDVLRHEFARSSSLFDSAKNVFLTLAGIPNQNLATNMNTSQTEPAWATYLKAVTFVMPATFLAIVSAIFVVPKLQQICRDAGLPEATAGGFWNLTHSSIQVMLVIANHGLLIVGTLLCGVLLLEWRFAQWPRYRRAAIGAGAFVLNSLVLFALFMMFLAAIVAAPGVHLPK